MALAPFTGDTSNPADNAVVSQYPSNERTHRDEIFSYLNVEHDSATGYHKFQELSTTSKNSLTTPPTGMLVYDTTLAKLQINTGTSGSPVWTDVMVTRPPGFIDEYAGSAAPSGWLVCDGSAVSRTTYAALFAAIGTIWGAGDGSTTFNLPNLQRRSTVGSGGTGTTALANTVGSTGGEETHTLLQAEIPNYNLTVTDPGHVHSDYFSNISGGGSPATTINTTSGTAINTGSATTGISVNSGGSGTAFTQYHPVAVVLKVIKT